MITAVLLTVVSAQLYEKQTRVDPNKLPKLVYELPVMGGQREIILGPKPQDFVLLNGYFEREIAAKPLATPDNTGGYVNSWVPGGTAEDNIGYMDCSTKPDNLFDKPCFLITTNAKWNQTLGQKPHQLKFSNLAKQQWWVTADGKILREYYSLQTPDGVQSADCTYGKDSIQRRYTNAKGETSFGELFPSCGMDALNEQFKPMVEGGNLVVREKEFSVVNALTGGVDKYTVRSGGTFKGEWLFATFKGRLFTIEGPNKLIEKAFLDDSGDLVKVALSEEKYFVINVLPPSHVDENGHPIRKPGR